ncbi:hypothetical protein D3C71_1755580 [compost metagenome]
MLGQVSRKAHQFLGMGNDLLRQRISDIEAGNLGVTLRKSVLRPAPDGARKCGLNIFRQSKGLGDFTTGHTGPVACHCCSQPSMAITVMAVNILDDLFAPAVLEVDIDIRRLVPLC